MSSLVSTVSIIIFVAFSGVCSGLNIALMSLDTGDLRRRAKLGHKGAGQILPLRQNYHLSLAAILLVNIAAVSATSLVLGNHFNGFIAGSLSTLLIVIFGEIFPQALFSKKALLFCSRLYPLLKAMIIITYPIAKPLQLLLDKLFGPEHARLQSRHELGLLITEHLGANESELDEDEVEIVRGALQLSEKQVYTIMTPIKSTFWLTPDTMLNSEKIDEIKATGHSRIPIFDKNLTLSYGVLLLRELLDFDYVRPTLISDLPLIPSPIVGSRTALDTMFRKFMSSKTHLIPIEKDDKIIGVVSIEDLIEEILGHEIQDETDHYREKV